MALAIENQQRTAERESFGLLGVHPVLDRTVGLRSDYVPTQRFTASGVKFRTAPEVETMIYDPVDTTKNKLTLPYFAQATSRITNNDRFEVLNNSEWDTLYRASALAAPAAGTGTGLELYTGYPINTPGVRRPGSMIQLYDKHNNLQGVDVNVFGNAPGAPHPSDIPFLYNVNDVRRMKMRGARGLPYANKIRPLTMQLLSIRKYGKINNAYGRVSKFAMRHMHDLLDNNGYVSKTIGAKKKPVAANTEAADANDADAAMKPVPNTDAPDNVGAKESTMVPDKSAEVEPAAPVAGASGSGTISLPEINNNKKEYHFKKKEEKKEEDETTKPADDTPPATDEYADADPGLGDSTEKTPEKEAPEKKEEEVDERRHDERSKIPIHVPKPGHHIDPTKPEYIGGGFEEYEEPESTAADPSDVGSAGALSGWTPKSGWTPTEAVNEFLDDPSEFMSNGYGQLPTPESRSRLVQLQKAYNKYRKRYNDEQIRNIDDFKQMVWEASRAIDEDIMTHQEQLKNDQQKGWHPGHGGIA